MAAIKRLLVYVLMSLTGAGADRDMRHTAAAQSFEAFMVEHGRSYIKGTGEYEMRRALYHRRLDEVQEHNSRPGRLWTAGINYLSDWTEPELKSLRGSRPIQAQLAGSAIRSHGAPESNGKFLSQVNEVVVPEQLSWTNLSSIRKSWDQASCGSCWAVATTIALHANSEIKGYDRSYSAQELVDCAPNPHKCGGDGGCQGSTVELAMNWIMEKGLADIATTPYTGKNGRCKKTVDVESPVYFLQGRNDGDAHGRHKLEDMIRIGFHPPESATSPGALLGLRGWTRLPENEYQPLLNALIEGPVAASLDAAGWSKYKGGIYDSCAKDTVIDHAVAVVGFGSDTASLDAGFLQKTHKYWIIKNSWGNNWGENGLLRLLRVEGDSYCGVDRDPAKGTGCVGGPSEVPVCGMCGIHYDTVAIHFNDRAKS